MRTYGIITYFSGPTNYWCVMGRVVIEVDLKKF